MRQPRRIAHHLVILTALRTPTMSAKSNYSRDLRGASQPSCKRGPRAAASSGLPGPHGNIV